MRVVYGINPVTEALASEAERVERLLVSAGRSGPAVGKVMEAARAARIRVERLPTEALTRAAGTPGHQGVVALLAGAYVYHGLDDLVAAWKESGQAAFFLILDSVQDPGNLGSLVRAAHAAGVHGVVIPRDRAAQVTPAVVKASAGATEHTLIARETNISRTILRLKELGVWAAALEADGPDEIYSTDISGDVALVVGSEGAGIRRLVKKSCDLVVAIPMARGFNSLNAAQAGAGALFEVRRQRLHGPVRK
ncbi:MAG: 23S rRNA (guanosine(2251)-2'-O)-methyltransferase RlmB [Thermodesulfobacteriota bacterium]